MGSLVSLQLHCKDKNECVQSFLLTLLSLNLQDSILILPEHTMLKAPFNEVGKTFSLEIVLKPLLFKEYFELPKMLSCFHRASLANGKEGDAVFLFTVLWSRTGTSEAHCGITAVLRWDHLCHCWKCYPVLKGLTPITDSSTSLEDIFQSLLSSPFEFLNIYFKSCCDI